MLRHATACLTTAIAIGSLTACGGPSSDADRVRDTTLAFMREMVDGDHDACDRLSVDGRRQIEGRARFFDLEDCADLIDAVAAEYSKADRRAMRKLRIGKVTIHGDRASIRDQDVRAPAELDGALEINDQPTVLRREHGQWKIEDLG